jgi:5-methylcytosine-specific restriction endonuclease McrA
MPARIERYRPARLAAAEPTKEVAHYRTADWRARRVRILTRDAYRCRTCGRVVYGRAAHVDHIVPLEDGGTDDDANLQVLCESDHGAKTREEQRRRGVL